VFDAVPLKLLKPFYDPFFYLKDVLRVISDMKREGVGVEDLKVLLEKQEEVFNAIAQKTNNNKLHQGEMGIEFYVNDNERDWLVFLDINKREEFLQKYGGDYKIE